MVYADGPTVGTELVQHPAIAAVGFMIAALLCAAVAIILDSVVTGRREAKRLVYLGIPATRDKG